MKSGNSTKWVGTLPAPNETLQMLHYAFKNADKLVSACINISQVLFISG